MDLNFDFYPSAHLAVVAPYQPFRLNSRTSTIFFRERTFVCRATSDDGQNGEKEKWRKSCHISNVKIK